MENRMKPIPKLTPSQILAEKLSPAAALCLLGLVIYVLIQFGV
jgi:hypothetical protein